MLTAWNSSVVPVNITPDRDDAESAADSTQYFTKRWKIVYDA